MTLYRPTRKRVAIGLLSGLAWATAGLVCVAYTADTPEISLFSLAGHAAVVLIGLCMMVDAMVARLGVDEDMIELRRLTGASIWARSDHPEAGAKLKTAIQEWRDTLTFAAQDVAYGEFSEVDKPGRWLTIALAIAVLAGSFVPFTFPNEVQNRKMDWAVALGYCAMLGIASIGFWRAGRFRVTLTLVCAAALFLLYMLTVAKLADVALDHTPPVKYRVRVLRARDVASHWSDTRRYSLFPYHYYYLDLAPWREQPQGASIRVRPRQAFLSFHEGDAVCLTVHSGRLGDPWYDGMPKCGP